MFRNLKVTVIVLGAVSVMLALAAGASGGLNTGAGHRAGGITDLADDARHPDLIALKFHADWCGKCKAMGPVFEDLTNKFDGKPVLFVRLDQTNKSKATQAEFLLAELGLGSIWNEYGGKTGFILLIDAKSGKQIDTLPYDMTFKQMKTRISSVLGQ